MQHFKNILVGFDVDATNEYALDHAIGLAQRNDAKLTVLYVSPKYESRLLELAMPTDDVVNKLTAESYKKIETMLKKMADDVDWRIDIVEGKKAYQTILDYARRHKSDLIVLGEHDTHSVDEILLGSNTEKIVRWSPCTVAVIKKPIQ